MTVTSLNEELQCKSTVSNLLKENGVPLVDLDVLAREAVARHSYALSQLSSPRHFGADILLPSGELDRAKLGEIVFKDEKRRKELNGIVHPAVRRLLAWQLVKCWARGDRVVVVDAPLLIEAGLWRFCASIIVVYCSEALQLQRLRTRNSLSYDEAQSRIKSQHPLSSKLAYADHVIDNSGELAELESQVERVVAKVHHQAGWTWILSWLVPPVGVVSAIVTVVYRLYIKRVGKPKRDGRTRPRGERNVEEIELKERKKLKKVASNL